MKSLYKLLRSRPAYLQATLALFVSGIGTAFTSVAVYEELAKQQFGAFGFAFAFAAGILPGLFTSFISGTRATKWNIGKALIFGELMGLVGLLFPLWGSFSHQIGFLLMAEVVSSAVSGLIFPIFKTFERSSFTDEEFGKVASLDSFLFTANFIFGQGLGSLLASDLTLRQFLSLDAVTYILALVLLFPLIKHVSRIAPTQDEPAKASRFSKKKAKWILPWLALVCAPPMILLPARAVEWGNLTTIFYFLTMAPVLLLICSRTLGQIIGPIIAAHMSLEKLSAKPMALPLALSIYLAFYWVAFTSNQLSIVAASVVLAHVASNVVYTIGNYELMKNFDANEIGAVSAWVYRMVTFITGISGLLLAPLASHFGMVFILAVSTTVLAVGAVLFLETKLFNFVKAR